MNTTQNIRKINISEIDNPSMASIILENNQYFQSKLKGHNFGNAISGQDIIHETILRILVLEKNGKVSHVKNPKAYVSRIFYNVIAHYANQLKKPQSNEYLFVRLDNELLKKYGNSPEDSSVERIKYYTEASAMIKLASEVLKGSRRDVFLSKAKDGLKLSQIAEKFGITPNNAKQLYNRAKNDLKKAVLLKVQKEEMYE